MLAAAIGIDRAVEADIRAVIGRDDGARGVADQRGVQARGWLVVRAPAIVEHLGGRRLEPSGRVRLRAAPVLAKAFGQDGRAARGWCAGVHGAHDDQPA